MSNVEMLKCSAEHGLLELLINIERLELEDDDLGAKKRCESGLIK